MKEYKVHIVVHGSKVVLQRVAKSMYANARSGRTKAGVTVTRFKPGEIAKVHGRLYMLPISFHRLADPDLNVRRDIRRALGIQAIVQNDTEPWLAVEPSIRER